MEKIIALTRGVPPTQSFATEKLQACVKTALQDYPEKILQYAKAAGFPPLREWVAEQYDVDASRVVIGTGSLCVLDHVLRSFPIGSLTVAIEEPTYDRTVTQLKRAQAQLVPCPIEKDGLNFAPLKEKLARGEKVDFFYVVSDFQNPTGSLMPLEKRKELVALAREYGFRIIEDLPYRRLRYNGENIPSCWEMAPDITLMMTSFSKLIAPGLRVGVMILPEELVAQTLRIAEDTYINASYVDQAIVYEFCKRGWLDEQLEELKALYGHRRDVMAKAMAEELSDLCDWVVPDGGFFIGAFVKKPIKMDTLLKLGKENGLQLTDGRGFYMEGGDQFVRLPFCALEDDEIKEGIKRLAKVLRDYPA
ncbi:MAG TPA: PLP-dependent aminotransferase family protein [Anaerolineaceae bacterium]|nr:PLP-dependent aminotransferase family protein [Anaerolineaceae bacterium]